MKFLFIALGGGLGAVSRYCLTILVTRLAGMTGFPWGTWVVNVLGCLLIGLGYGFFATRHWVSEPLRLFLIVGFLGGFTTFSSFAWENYDLARLGQIAETLLNMTSQVVIGFLAVCLGVWFSRLMT